MGDRKALLILHGKQALNEAVRAAVEIRCEQGWELPVRMAWETGDAQRLVGEALCPQALVDDGLLDTSILPAPQEEVGTLKNLLTEGFGIDSMFVRAGLPRVEIKVSEGLCINLDGEPLEGHNLCFSVRPAALLVHLPEDSPPLRAGEAPSHQG